MIAEQTDEILILAIGAWADIENEVWRKFTKIRFTVALYVAIKNLQLSSNTSNCTVKQNVGSLWQYTQPTGYFDLGYAKVMLES